MYIPENAQFNLRGASKNSREPRMKMKSYNVLIVFAVLAMMLIAGILLYKADSEVNSVMTTLPHDLEQLWNWSNKVLEEGAGTAEWTLRWNVTMTSDASLQGLTASLFTDQHGEMTEKLITNGGKSIRGKVERLGGVLSIHMQEEMRENDQLIVLLETGSDVRTLEQLLTSVAIIGEQLAIQSSHTEASMKVHGFAKSQEVVKEVKRLSLGRVIEEYKDEGTWSITLKTSSLLSSQQLDKNRSANLQIAAHEHTERKMTELTMGVPLITGDFSSTKDN